MAEEAKTHNKDSIESARRFGALMGKIDKAREESRKRFLLSIVFHIITLIALILIGLLLL